MSAIAKWQMENWKTRMGWKAHATKSKGTWAGRPRLGMGHL